MKDELNLKDLKLNINTTTKPIIGFSALFPIWTIIIGISILKKYDTNFINPKIGHNIDPRINVGAISPNVGKTNMPVKLTKL